MVEKLKWATWLLIGLAIVVGYTALVAVDKAPAEPLIAIASAAVTAIFEERKYFALDKSWQQWYEKTIQERGK